MADIMNTASLERLFTALPKAELHVHLEGSIEPSTLVELAARHGVSLTIEEAAARYAPGDFAQFIEAFNWVTSLLRGPADYALIARRFAESMQRQNVLYAEVTLSIGVMLRRKQDPAANFAALREAASAGSRSPPRVDFRRRPPMGRGPGDGSRQDCRAIALSGHRRIRSWRR